MHSTMFFFRCGVCIALCQLFLAEAGIKYARATGDESVPNTVSLDPGKLKCGSDRSKTFEHRFFRIAVGGYHLFVPFNLEAILL